MESDPPFFTLDSPFWFLVMLQDLKFVIAVFAILDIDSTEHDAIQSWACLEHMCLQQASVKKLVQPPLSLYKPCLAPQTRGQHRLPPSVSASGSLRHRIWTGWLRDKFCYWPKNRMDWSCVTGNSKYLDCQLCRIDARNSLNSIL